MFCGILSRQPVQPNDCTSARATALMCFKYKVGYVVYQWKATMNECKCWLKTSNIEIGQQKILNGKSKPSASFVLNPSASPTWRRWQLWATLKEKKKLCHLVNFTATFEVRVPIFLAKPRPRSTRTINEPANLPNDERGEFELVGLALKWQMLANVS